MGGISPTLVLFGLTLLAVQNVHSDDHVPVSLMCGTDDLIGKTRGAEKSKFGRWPDGIVPFKFDDTVNDDDKAAIRAGINEVEKHTCIRFPDFTNEEHYLTTRRSGACNPNQGWGSASSYVGRTYPSISPQPLFTSAGSCWDANNGAHVALWVHEIMHALGVMHTQTRLDRDDYITVHQDNIDPNRFNNYKMCSDNECNAHGLPYDCQSTMHYRDYFFKVDDAAGPTMTAKDPNTCNLKTGGDAVIATDWELLNIMYDCPAGGDDDTPCSPDNKCDVGKGDCDTHEDCGDGLVCGINNCHTDFQGRPGISALPSDADCCMEASCDAGPTAWDCCQIKGGCDINEGDCDSDADCNGDLVCGVDNCADLGKQLPDGSPVNSSADCCIASSCDAGPLAWDCCKNKVGGCREYEGDCDSDDECADNFVCGTNNCHTLDRYSGKNINETADCCIPLTDTDKVGGALDWNKACTNNTQCAEGQGDCDHDGHCQGQLICGINNCDTANGANETADCCKVAACDGSNTAWSCCSADSKCGHGEGDCDTHDDCEDGMFCGANNCEDFNTDDPATGSDCCYKPDCNGHGLAFNCCGPDSKCSEGQGDCDADEDCADGLKCGFNNCADFTDNTIDGAAPDVNADCCI